MKNIEEINQSIVKKIVAERKHPEFFPGDIVKVGVRITEGKRDRIQYFHLASCRCKLQLPLILPQGCTDDSA